MTIAAGVGVLSTFGASPGFASDGGITPSPTTAKFKALVKQQADTRAVFGLRHDPSYVERLAAASSRPATTRLGMPMSADEAQDMDARRNLGFSISAIDALLAGDSSYAGSWIDQAAGGELNVAFTEAPNSLTQAAVQALLPPGSSFRAATVSHSLASLKEIAARIEADMIAVTAAGGPADIVSSGVDQSANAIALAVSTAAPAGFEDIVRARYGADNVVVTREPVAEASASRDIRSGRLFGGEWIRGGNDESCTVTYANAKNTNGETYAITAGHCGSNGTVFFQGRGNTPYIGSVHANGTYGRSSTNCDCAPVGPIAPGAGLGTNRFLVNNNVDVAAVADRAPYDGEPICHTGAASFEARGAMQCGSITQPTTSQYTYHPRTGYFTLTDAIKSTNIHSQSGDSGSPIYDGTVLIGLLSSSPNSTTTVGSKMTNLRTVGLYLSYTT